MATKKFYNTAGSAGRKWSWLSLEFKRTAAKATIKWDLGTNSSDTVIMSRKELEKLYTSLGEFLGVSSSQIKQRRPRKKAIVARHLGRLESLV